MKDHRHVVGPSAEFSSSRRQSKSARHRPRLLGIGWATPTLCLGDGGMRRSEKEAVSRFPIPGRKGALWIQLQACDFQEGKSACLAWILSACSDQSQSASVSQNFLF